MRPLPLRSMRRCCALKAVNASTIACRCNDPRCCCAQRAAYRTLLYVLPICSKAATCRAARTPAGVFSRLPCARSAAPPADATIFARLALLRYIFALLPREEDSHCGAAGEGEALPGGNGDRGGRRWGASWSPSPSCGLSSPTAHHRFPWLKMREMEELKLGFGNTIATLWWSAMVAATVVVGDGGSWVGRRRWQLLGSAMDATED
ncbi:hypothetical protein Dimus_022498 [Dionaea muscipula]